MGTSVIFIDGRRVRTSRTQIMKGAMHACRASDIAGFDSPATWPSFKTRFRLVLPPSAANLY
jgi:hypothetical protein